MLLGGIILGAVEEEQKRIKKEVERIFKENKWNPKLINYISVQYDENMDLKAIMNHDKENYILKHIWVREDFRGTGYTQKFLRDVFKEMDFTLVWEPNICFIKSMIKADLGLHKKIDDMEIWNLIPQMMSDVSNGYISKHDYLIKKNGYHYTLGSGPDKNIVVSLVTKDMKNIKSENEYNSVMKDGEEILRQWKLIWNKCDIKYKVQEFCKDFSREEAIVHNNKLRRSKSFVDEQLNRTVEEYREARNNMKLVDLETDDKK